MDSNGVFDLYVEQRDLYVLDTVRYRMNIKHEFVFESTGNPYLNVSEKEDYIQDHLIEFTRYIACRFKVTTVPIPCGKKVFSRAQADEALKLALLSTSAKRKEKRKYWCSFCKGWHLTSQRRRRPINPQEE